MDENMEQPRGPGEPTNGMLIDELDALDKAILTAEARITQIHKLLRDRGYKAPQLPRKRGPNKAKKSPATPTTGPMPPAPPASPTPVSRG